MSFDDLPPQSPINPKADAYAARALELSRAVAAAVPCRLDLAYGPDYWQKVDVYLPPGGGRDLPVVAFLHGGGWTHGYKEWMGFMAPPITALPAVFVSVSYRLAPRHRYPVHLHDGLAALAWLRRNAAEFGGSPDRIVVGGHSAGGHLSTLMALRTDLYDSFGLPADTVKACLPVSATYDFRFANPEPGSGEEKILTQFLPDPSLAWEASALAHVAGGTTPFLICHGSEDLERTMRTAPPMVAALRAEGAPVEYLVVEGRDHFTINLGMADPDDPWVRAAGAWIGRHA